MTYSRGLSITRETYILCSDSGTCAVSMLTSKLDMWEGESTKLGLDWYAMAVQCNFICDLGPMEQWKR